MADVLKSATVVTERPDDFCAECWELIKGRLLMAEFETVSRKPWEITIRHEQDHWQSEAHLTTAPLVLTVQQKCRPLAFPARTGPAESVPREWWTPDHGLTGGLAKEDVRRQDDGTYTGTYHLSVTNIGIRRGYHRAFACAMPLGVLTVSGPSAPEFLETLRTIRDQHLAGYQAEIDGELARRRAQAEVEQAAHAEDQRYSAAIERFAKAAGVEAGIVATFHGIAMSISREDLDTVSEKLKQLKFKLPETARVERTGE